MRNYKQKHNKSHQDRQGAAAVEMAVVLPVFMMLTFGMLELGSAIHHAHIMTTAVREGARLAAMDFSAAVPVGSTANEKVISDMRNFLDAGGIPGDETTITITHVGGALDGQDFDLEDENNDLKTFRISASVPYEQISVSPLNYFAGVNIRANFAFQKGNSQLSN